MGSVKECPFFRTDGLEKRGASRLSCEHGKLTFYDRDAMRSFMKKYCRNFTGWQSCSLASSLLKYYDREEKKNERSNIDRQID